MSRILDRISYLVWNSLTLLGILQLQSFNGKLIVVTQVKK